MEKRTLNLSARTAIARTKLSSPMAYLVKQGLIKGQSLDYGCGRGTDADLLNMRKYDPYWQYQVLNLQVDTYDTVTCHYVLNVIPNEHERDSVLDLISLLLKPGGKAYISVRADVKQDGYTSKGTWQGNIFLNLPLLKSTRQYRMYVMTKDGGR